MSKKSIKKNYIFNLSYQVLLLLAPLITTPYLSRVLGADGIGTVSFIESIVSYFTLFAILGITTYGQREISYVQNNKEKRSHVFWETKLLEIITSSIVLIFYILFSLFQTNRMLYLILSLNIISVMVDITWFFQGMEEFGRIVLRNVVFKIAFIIFVFCTVKSRDDLIVYIFGIAALSILGNISLWSQLPKFVDKPIWKEIKPIRNLRVVILLFIPTIAIQIYTVLDKTMIGLITQSSFENGYYEQALKISKMVMTIVTALGTVMIPRIGYHFAQGDTEKVNYFMYMGYRFVWFLGIPLCFGLIGTANNFVPWFFGEGFDKVVPLINILSFLIIAIGINSITGVQYLIPTKRENLFTMTVIIGAIVNFTLNYFLIRQLQSIGAAIASVVAETTIALVQLWLVKNEFSIKRVILSSGHYLIAGCIMLILIKSVGIHMTPSIFHTMVLVVFGAAIYFIVLLLLRDSFFIDNVNNAKDKILKKIRC